MVNLSVIADMTVVIPSNLLFIPSQKLFFFCLACVLFPMGANESSRAKILIAHPYNDWKHGSEELKGHSILQYHKDSMARFENFITTMKNIE